MVLDNPIETEVAKASDITPFIPAPRHAPMTSGGAGGHNNLPDDKPAPAAPFVEPTSKTFIGFALIQFWTPSPIPSVIKTQPTPVFGLTARMFAAS